jgi:hypothetical protein
MRMSKAFFIMVNIFCHNENSWESEAICSKVVVRHKVNPDYSSVDDFGRFRGQGAKVWWSMIDFGTC